MVGTSSNSCSTQVSAKKLWGWYASGQHSRSPRTISITHFTSVMRIFAQRPPISCLQGPIGSAVSLPLFSLGFRAAQNQQRFCMSNHLFRRNAFSTLATLTSKPCPASGSRKTRLHDLQEATAPSLWKCCLCFFFVVGSGGHRLRRSLVSALWHTGLATTFACQVW